MKFIIALFASLIAFAVANPIVNPIAREPATCQIFGLICTGGVDSEFCEGLGFQCQGKGKAPISSDPTCEANCICPC
ncbi:hypothetical protein C8R43DRAFT_1138418 [Mycena crocata]|nr:hypothetical protein C8R43DRAFT_1138418 [Mycena crocata]